MEREGREITSIRFSGRSQITETEDGFELTIFSSPEEAIRLGVDEARARALFAEGLGVEPPMSGGCGNNPKNGVFDCLNSGCSGNCNVYYLEIEPNWHWELVGRAPQPITKPGNYCCTCPT